jgi:precorrin-8X/cobalt-precorrin-8 methylmutase
MIDMNKVGVVVLAHGSRGERGASEVPEVLQKLSNGLKLLLSSEVEISGAALQFNHPSLEEAAEAFISSGIKSIIIAPYFLFPGRHLTEHVPQAIAELKRSYPDAQFTVTENLGLQEYFVELIARRITDAYPGIAADTPPSIGSSEMIEKQSMLVIESLLPTGMDANDREVTKRIIHASGDPTIAHLIKFSEGATKEGMRAIAEGRPIYTDVRMAAAGINRKLSDSFACHVHCALDEFTPGESSPEAGTRSASAMLSLGTRLNNSIVAVGNAPTALLALVDMVRKNGISPALVVGMPVGFIMARESKIELTKLTVPYITISGTRGGSALAAASINALLRLSIQPSK